VLSAVLIVVKMPTWYDIRSTDEENAKFK